MTHLHTIHCNRDRKRLDAIKAYISEHIAGDLRAAMVARHFGLSASAFLHAFKKNGGQSYGAYVKEIRIKKAFALLQDSGMRIKEIMYAAGYTNRAAFNSAFKKKYGRPPGYFKK